MRLGVNVDHIATLRNARLSENEKPMAVHPDPVRAALVCQRAGAHSIVMHLREDRRHIRDRDLFRAKENLKIGLNMEMSIAPDVVGVALRVKPRQVTLVPEKRMERTTEGGLDLRRNPSLLARAIGRLRDRGIKVSLFIDPDTRQIEIAKKMKVDAVEFHTGDYAEAFGGPGRSAQWKRLCDAVLAADHRELTAHAGHGLDYGNVPLIKKITGLDELNIGYSIIARSLQTGLENAVKEMKRLVS
jgi:pyridoxine 5-phosphate synthase